jgi:hypothetical protein
LGANVTLAVTASGTAPLNYQWTFNGLPLADQTASTLTLNNIQSGQLGDYAVTVTNGCGTNAVGPFTISTPPAESPAAPVIRTMNFLDGVFHVTFATEAGLTYAVDYKDHLSDPTWITLETFTGDGQEHTIVDAPPLPVARFYRARVVGP